MVNRQDGLEILGDGLEIINFLLMVAFRLTRHNVQTVIKVILDQYPFCLRYRLLNSVHLLGDFTTGTASFNHRDNTAQMALRPLQALDDPRMCCM